MKGWWKSGSARTGAEETACFKLMKAAVVVSFQLKHSFLSKLASGKAIEE
jgi:hypothetical protein